MITNQDILNVIAEAINKLVQEQCQANYLRGVERGSFEERMAVRKEAERKGE